MYVKDGHSIFVVDGHVHFWDASPENQLNRYGDGWIRCFYDYHRNLSPKEYVWPLELYQKYPEERMMRDLFEEADLSELMTLAAQGGGATPHKSLPARAHQRRDVGPELGPAAGSGDPGT